MLSRKGLAKSFFTNVYTFVGPFMDKYSVKEKKKLIPPNAHGVVLDIGAGENN